MSSPENPFVSGQPVGYGEAYVPLQFPISQPVSKLSEEDLRRHALMSPMYALIDKMTEPSPDEQARATVLAERLASYSPDIMYDPETLLPDLRDEETRFEVARQLIEFVIGEPYKDEDIMNGWATLFIAQVRIFDALNPDTERLPDEDAVTMRERVEAELLDAYQKYTDIKEVAATPTAGPSIRYASAQDYMKENGGTWPWYYRALDWLSSPLKR